MRIRLLQLANNFYKDKKIDDIKGMKGNYCGFGYYDAINVEQVCEVTQDRKDIWNALQEAACKHFNGNRNWRTLVCGILDNDLDVEFWDSASSKLFVFITMIRINADDNASYTMLKTIVEDINKPINNSGVKRDKIAYYSNDHCQVVIVKCCDNFCEGFNDVIAIQKVLDVVSMHTIFGAQEGMLENEAVIKQMVSDERVNARLTMVVKQRGAFENFKEQLCELITESECKIITYNTLGASDYVLDIENVSLAKFLSFYNMGSVLTVGDKDYFEAVYHIETELWPVGEWNVYGKENK